MAPGWRTRARVLAALAVGGGLSMTAPVAAAHASARPSARTTTTHVTVTLRPRDPAALAAYARAVSTPGSPQYGHYLTPSRFAARFGATPARIHAVRAALRARGLRPGPTSAGGLSIPLTATTARVRRGLAFTPTARPPATPGHAPAVAAAVARLPAGVQTLLGLDTSLAARPLAVRAPAARARAATVSPAHHAHPATAGPQPCAAVSAAAPTQGAYTDDQIASAYGFGGLYAAGDEGAGTTVAVYELEPNDPADIATFQACYGTHASISYVHVDGGAGSGAGSDEAAFDIENLIGFAPGARVLVYQGPNSNSGAPGSGPYDTFSAIVNQDRARVATVSWGQCEAQLGRSSATAESTLFEQAAVQGQTIVAASGDNGAQDCDTAGPNSSTRPAVDDPAAQPNVTGVGGTTLAATGDPPRETAWNSGANAPLGALAPGAGGGGVSSLWAMAPDQLAAPARLGLRTPAATGAACGEPSGYCRAVPDVSADADPATGYDIYWNGADTVPEPAGWQALGGTSGAAPLWAALFTLADASPACHGSPIGFAGPALYRAAAQRYAADFHDVTSGNNDFTHTNGGRYAAVPGYDLATGLGTPDATPLVATLCADSVRLRVVPGQSSAVRAGVALRLRATDVRGAQLRYSASHLPVGVTLDPVSGRLRGRPSKPGVYRVRAGVRDAQGARAQTRFTWSVGGAPHLERAALNGGGVYPRLSIAVGTGRHVPGIRALAITLPPGLRATSSRAIAVTQPPPTQGQSTSEPPAVRVSGSVVTITLSPARASVDVTAALRGTGGRAAPTTHSLAVAVQAGSTGTSSLTARLPGGR